MRRIVRLVIILSVLAGVAAPASLAAERMWVGFHDDPSFRWVTNRQELVAGSAQNNASIIRLLVQWNLAAKTRPANATDPFDPAYEFDDVDEAVRSAQENDQEVILTISGTPRWANGGKNPNVMPTRVADFTSFSRAIASRYSGRFMGYPFVRFWSIWNEPNLQLFLSPQFDSRGRSVAPANYAKLAAAGYAGLKAGNPQAQIAIGETSARGSDKATGLRPTHSPGKFAELVAKANPRLKFDAWSHHPYPSVPNLPPSQVVKWPNVSLASLPKFEESLKTLFKRKSVPIWITEYGHQTRPEDSLGIPYSQQAAYIQQSISIAAGFPFVNMFIWFVYQDDQGQPWDSGHLHPRRSAEGNVAREVHRKRAATRCAQRPRARPGRNAHAPAQRLHEALLRERHDRNADRDDVARVQGGTPHQRRAADRAPQDRLFDRGPRHREGRSRQRHQLHGDLRDERSQRRHPEPPHHPPRHIVTRPRRAPASPPTTEGHRVSCRRS